MASAVQERRQATADSPGRAGKEDPVTHHRYSYVTMRPNRRCTARCFPFNRHPPDDQLSDPRLLPDDGICKSEPSLGRPGWSKGW
jgi:hypothetical protein